MKLIVAVDSHWGIGSKNELLIRIPGDQKRFRQITTGNAIVLGRKTMDTFPGKAPLKDRVNIVLSKNTSYDGNGAVVVHSVEELLTKIKEYSEEVFVVGGASIYEQLLPYCNVAYVTKIDHVYEADAYFPNLDEFSDWTIEEESEEQTYFDITYTYVKYVNNACK